MRLKGRVAIVTGAARGIGRAIAAGMAREGAAIVVNDVSAGNRAAELQSEIQAGGGRAVVVQGDVADLDAHERLASAAVENFGGLHILVNNAGIAIRTPFLEARPEDWDRVLAVNLRGAYFLAQRAAREMTKRGSGKIINISSVHDTHPMANSSIYSISKAGMVMLSKALALELAPQGIGVNTISPGAILTDENRPRLEDPAYAARVLAKIPSGRVGSVDEIVGAAVYLASAESDYVTGATLYIDGGMLLR